MSEGRVLGLDLGERRIGVALSDPGRIIASPHEVLARSGRREQDHEAIVAMARREGAAQIVVGLPRSLSGRAGPAAEAVLAEVEELRALVPAGMAVDTYDERLTTVVAENALREGGLAGQERRGVVDKVAAAVMLQGWLDSMS